MGILRMFVHVLEHKKHAIADQMWLVFSILSISIKLPVRTKLIGE